MDEIIEIIDNLKWLHTSLDKLSVTGEAQANIYLGCMWKLEEIIKITEKLAVKDGEADG